MRAQLAEPPSPKRLSSIISPPTSAGATITAPIGHVAIFVGEVLYPLGTASTEGAVEQTQVIISQDQTNSGVPEQTTQSSSSAILELRRLSGLTWDQLARLFGVSPRTLHFWASGKLLTPTHEEHLHRLLATIRWLDRGSAQENRSLLLGALEDGSVPFDLLIERRYELVSSLLGRGRSPSRPKAAPLSAEARSGREPYAPDDLAGALQDRVHTDVGKAWIPRVSRNQK